MRAIRVNHARVPRDHGTRDEVERWFGRVPVERLGLGEREIFYVPRLHLRLRGPPGALDGRIPDILFEELRALLAAAGRGGQTGFSPGRAYVFESRGRYLAWLIRLWVGDRSAAAREAFRGATGHCSLSNWQRVAVLGRPQDLVSTIARLAETGHAALWLERFDSADLAIARQALRSGFGLVLPEPLVHVAPHPSPASLGAEVSPMSEPATLLRETVDALRSHGNDWNPLPAPARALLLASALLARSPSSAVRNGPSLAARIAAFAAKPEAMGAVPAPVAWPPPAEGRSGRGPAAAAGPIAAPGRSPQSTVAQPAVPFRSNGPVGHEPRAAQGRAEAREGRLPEPGPAPIQVARRPPAPSALTPAEPFLAADCEFDSAFGGLLFLINAFVALGLYPDFTQPLGLRLDPSPLWLVDRIGRWRFGALYRRDPLAGWITGNAARGSPPRQWRAKEEWLAGFGAAPSPRLFVGRARTTLWHSAGFPLLDGPTPGLARTARRLGPRKRAGSGRRHARLPSRGPDRWVACLALYLEARLRLCGAGLSLLELPARVRVRDLDLHAGFRLDAHPIALRMAGLDRDPGWQPAEGRSIAFAFE